MTKAKLLAVPVGFDLRPWADEHGYIWDYSDEFAAEQDVEVKERAEWVSVGRVPPWGACSARARPDRG